MQKLLEERQRLGIVEHDRRDPRPVGGAVLVEDLVAEALDERGAHVEVGASR